MHNELRQLLLSSGFDPALGFLHQQYPGRDALVLDFSELFRAGVDSFVLQLLAAGELTPDSFYYRQTEGCRLSKHSRSIFFKAWAQMRQYWPRATVDMDDQNDWPTTAFSEQVRGQVAVLREYIQTLECAHG
jgi:CRISPR-associated protein Cas1